MNLKEVLILGSTGTIGEKTLQVIATHRSVFQVTTLVANSNVKKIAEQAIFFKPRNVAIFNEKHYFELKQLLAHLPEINIVAGWHGIQEILDQQYDITIAAIMGIACLKPLVKVLPNTKVLGLANKESIISAGAILTTLAKRYNTKIIPIDSEHSAIYQILKPEYQTQVKRVTLTASGGPFYNKTLLEMQHVQVHEAIKHPTWNMGAKISVDSATLMNKGLELIEAHHLFNLDHSQLQAVIHPQSYIHALVEYIDGSILTQMSNPDMKVPISIALGYPSRLNIDIKALSWEELSSAQFFEPDYARFPCLRLALEALKTSQESCIILNTANEIAVSLFLQNQIPFLEIPQFIEEALCVEVKMKVQTINDVLHFIDNFKNLLKAHAKFKVFETYFANF